jgi:UDP-N-acetylenolpyruvoylglucosamine reductase
MLLSLNNLIEMHMTEHLVLLAAQAKGEGEVGANVLMNLGAASAEGKPVMLEVARVIHSGAVEGLALVGHELCVELF